MIKDVFKKRKESREKPGDFLDAVLEELEKEDTILDEGSAISLIFSLLVLAKEGPANGIALAIKFISKNPRVLVELKVLYIMQTLTLVIFLRRIYGWS